MEDIDWKAKYKSMKKRFRELQNLRIDSVKTDIDDLERKIDEHRKVHQLAVKELKRHNDSMGNAAGKIIQCKDEIERIEASVRSLTSDLKFRDSILKVVLDYESFYVDCIEKGRFKITATGKYQVVFELKKELDAPSIVYTPVSVPDAPNPPDFISQVIKFSSADLRNFCDTIQDFISE